MPKESPQVQLNLTPSGLGSKVLINGTDISCDTRAVTVRAEAGEVTNVEIALVAARTTIETAWGSNVTLSPATQAVLVELGWTPPEVPVGEFKRHLSPSNRVAS